MHALERNYIRNPILDVFNNEPDVRMDVLAAAELVSPHIAGHSYEGKLNGTVMVYEAACRHFGIAPAWTSGPNATPIDITLDAYNRQTALYDRFTTDFAPFELEFLNVAVAQQADQLAQLLMIELHGNQFSRPR